MKRSKHYLEIILVTTIILPTIISGSGNYHIALMLTFIPTLVCIQHLRKQVRERSDFSPSEFEHVYDHSNITTALKCLAFAISANLVALYFLLKPGFF